jgi:undecaprenyl-diphosphatase
MTYLEAIVLGLVQGMFMFVPVSSTAHLVLTQHLMISGGSQIPPPDSPAMILFDLVVHVDTVISIAVVFWRSLSALMQRTFTETTAKPARPDRVVHRGVNHVATCRGP